MAESQDDGNVTTNNPALNGAEQPQAGLVSQYVKDLSVENPNAPDVYQWKTQNSHEIEFRAESAQLSEELFEVVCTYTLTAKGEKGVAYIVELAYAAIMGARGLSNEDLQRFLFADTPRIVFPNIRLIMANVTRDAGFAPVMIEPIDFNALFDQRLAEGRGPQDMTPAGNA